VKGADVKSDGKQYIFHGAGDASEVSYNFSSQDGRQMDIGRIFQEGSRRRFAHGTMEKQH
jgi:hypothetical protein